MNEEPRSAFDIPPIAAIFIGSTWVTIRPRVWSALPENVRARIRCIRYEPDSHFESAFIEELQQALGELAQLLEAGDAGISVLVVTELHKPIAESRLAPLLSRATPAHVSCPPVWLGSQVPSGQWPATPGSTVLLSTTWRGGRVQGGALEDAYRTLVLCFLATARSRFREANFDTFSDIRFAPSARRLLCSVESAVIGDFRWQAEKCLESSIAGHYFPLISNLAAQKAREHAPSDPTGLLQLEASDTVLELQIAEPLLCAAISDADGVEAVCERLGYWRRRASEPVKNLLAEWILTFRRWQDETETQVSDRASAELARPLFESCPFPALYRFTARLTSKKGRAARECCIQRIAREIAAAKRAQLDTEHYDFLPSDWGPTQRAGFLAAAFESDDVKSAFVTRHFPEEMLRDLRDEVLLAPGRSAALYWLQIE
ncbi:MAG TPA: hypothetical protein VH351_13040 [Bryobacteraceae bacterium]|nr:hypothetical protein [Bryobacteraceae bacterium]